MDEPRETFQVEGDLPIVEVDALTYARLLGGEVQAQIIGGPLDGLDFEVVGVSVEERKG